MIKSILLIALVAGVVSATEYEAEYAHKYPFIRYQYGPSYYNQPSYAYAVANTGTYGNTGVSHGTYSSYNHHLPSQYYRNVNGVTGGQYVSGARYAPAFAPVNVDQLDCFPCIGVPATQTGVSYQTVGVQPAAAYSYQTVGVQPASGYSYQTVGVQPASGYSYRTVGVQPAVGVRSSSSKHVALNKRETKQEAEQKKAIERKKLQSQCELADDDVRQRIGCRKAGF